MDSINRSFRHSLAELHAHGEINTIRGVDRMELIDWRFVLTVPQNRVLTAPFRYNNIFATVAEVLWVFAGRDDMEWLTNFLPNAINYSDDGRIWGAAYGPRLREYWGAFRRKAGVSFVRQRNKVDQLQNIVDILTADPASTQAVINIYSADRDQNLLGGTKDTPCTMYLQFLIRGRRLHCICKMRTGDALWGVYNINVVEWMFLQEVLALVLDVEVGSYMHNAGSFHYYLDKEVRIKKMLEAPFFDVYDYFTYTPIDNISNLRQFYANLDAAINWVEDTVLSFKVGNSKVPLDRGSFTSDYIYAMAKMSVLYLRFINGSYKYAALELLRDELIPEDLRIAGLEFMVRRLKKVDGKKADDDLDLIIKRLKKRYRKKFPAVFDFITQDWYEAHRI